MPLVILIGLMGGAVTLFGLAAIDGPVQVALILSAMVAAVVALKNGNPWSEISAAGGRAWPQSPALFSFCWWWWR